MAKIKVIKKNDEYSSDYKVGDILEAVSYTHLTLPTN